MRLQPLLSLQGFPPLLLRLTGALGVGALAGALGLAFAESLDSAVRLHRMLPWLLAFLPFASLLLLMTQRRWGSTTHRGQALLLEEIESSEPVTPKRLIPLLWISALISQFVGASVGREGGAVQLGGAIGSLAARLQGSQKKHRAGYLIAGMSGGFTGCFGTPFAAALFALEVRAVATLDREHALDSAIGAAAAFAVRNLWLHAHGSTHSTWPKAPWTWELVHQPRAWAAAACLILALSVLGRVTLAIWRLLKKGAPSNPWITAATYGAALLTIDTLLDPGQRLRGLGIEALQSFFQTPSHVLDVPGKIVATGLSLALGFKGGELIPLAFIGAATGSLIASQFSLPLGPLAAGGFVALFASVAQAPISMTLLSLELFVPWTASGEFFLSLGAFSALCWLTFVVSPEAGIYSGQRPGLVQGKRALLWRPWRYFTRSGSSHP